MVTTSLMGVASYLRGYSNTAFLTYGKPTHIAYQQQRWRTARTLWVHWTLQGHPWPEALFCLARWSPPLPFNMFSLTLGRWNQRLHHIASADLSHVFFLFFPPFFPPSSGLESGLGDASGQRERGFAVPEKVKPKPFLCCFDVVF